ncbi:kinase non-catalytic C-lobe domain-containing protein 1-like [Gigantopelta aegis]|uniref:kinase non-catalytic C-lobe domain-containing protein 1-like n=1 Tax=Gigantopelta aegis TaxID=1735272 RepID=UPI001B889011|nr:kinase non-catalytic C-lobe domain-containing protein 1-like [Gigantopelta aegis]
MCRKNNSTMDVAAAPHEGDETVSLVEVLAARDGYLSEEELWAFCRECCLTLEYIEGSRDLCQSLCLSPETLAFDSTGSVCFLDLDIDPDPVYVPPEYEDCCSSIKSHLFSVGMSMLYAVRYTVETDNPRPMLGDTITDLLGQLTCDEVTKRPDLLDVIRWCDDALQGRSSQDICLKLCSAFTQTATLQEGSSILELTSGLSAYLQSQSGLVTSPESNHSDFRDSVTMETEYESHFSHSQERVNCVSSKKFSLGDNSMVDSHVTESEGKKQNDSLGDSGVEFVSPYKVDVNASCSNKKNSSEEKIKVLHLQDGAEGGLKETLKKKEGMTVNDLLDILDRYLQEQELWALCKEGVIALQRKKKHLPAYISPDTVVVREDGSLSFKPIPEDKPLEVVFMAPELQQKGILSEQTCLYGLGMTLRCAAGQEYSTSMSLPVSQKFENLLVAMLQTNAEKRPTLMETLDICSELELSVKATASSHVCKTIYEAAIAELASPADHHDCQDHHDEDESELCQLYEQTKHLPDNPSEYENLRASTEHTNVESPWEEICEAGGDLQPIRSPPSAFRPVPGTPTKPHAISSMGLHLKALDPSKPSSDRHTVPTAFSSPSTHFTPIVIQRHLTQKAETSPDTKTDVMKKLKDLKQDLLKHKSACKTGDGDKSHVGKGEVTPATHQSVEGDRSLEVLLSRLQSDGQMPNMKVLASAIAQYLQGHTEPLGERIPQTGDPSQSSSPRVAPQAVFSQTNSINSTIPPVTSIITSQTTSLPGSQPTSMVGHNPLQVASSQVLSSASSTYNTTEMTANMISQNLIQTEAGSSQVISSQSSNTFQTIPQNANLIGQNPHNSYSTLPQTNVVGQKPMEGVYQTVRQPANLTGDKQQTTTQVYHQANVAQPQECPVIPGVNIAVAGHHTVMNQGLAIPVQYGNNILPSYPMQLHHDPVTGLMHLVPVNVMPYGRVQGRGSEQYSNVFPFLDRRSDDGHSVSDSDRSIQNTQKAAEGSVCSYSSSVSETYGRTSNTAVNQSNTVRTTSRNSDQSHNSQVYSSVHSGGHSTTPCSDGQRQQLSRMLTENERQNSEDYDLPRKTPTYENIWRGVSQNEHPNIHDNYHDPVSVGSQRDCVKYLSPDRLTSTTGKYVRVNEKHNSASSSPSPSKDSGVSGLTTSHVLGPQNTDASLMDRLLSTESIHQQRLLGRVLQLIREECDLERYNTEDLAIAEYVTSLGGVKWETFSSAVTEKYSDLCWREDVMARLYQIVSDQRPSAADKYIVKGKTPVSIKEDTRQEMNRDGRKHQRTNSAPGFVINHDFSNGGLSTTSSQPTQPAHEGSDPTGAQSHHREARPHNDCLDRHFYESIDRTTHASSSKHHYESLNRPHSVCQNRLAVCVSETSDSTDTERLEKRRRFKKRYELDRAKSSSMHSLTRSQSGSATVTSGAGDAHSKQHDVTGFVNQYDIIRPNEGYVSRTDNVRRNEGDGYKSDGVGQNQGFVSKPDIDRQNEGHHSKPDGIGKSEDYVPKYDSVRQDQGHLSKPDRTSLQASGASSNQPSSNRNVNTTQTDSVVYSMAHNNKHRLYDSSGEDRKQEIPSSHHTSASCEPGNTSHSNSADVRPVRSLWTNNAGYERADRGRGKATPTSNPLSVFPRNRPPQHGMQSSFTPSRSRPQRHYSADSLTTLHTGGISLVKYHKRDSVVYHWAMTQHHEVQEIISFLQTIEHDEENKERLEHRLKQTQQELDVVGKQRRKTQRLYQKLTTPHGKSHSKGDQTSVSGQMLKDLAEMTKNLRFLTLCKNHLQMLLCELYGLDECFLYSLATSLPSQPLVLRPYESNPALQFQCVNKPLIGCDMRVLQAGECEGLLAYLYVSSALSAGYVQQFLYCFRYFVTVEQVLDFILDKYTGSQKGNSGDKNLFRIRCRSLDLLTFWLEGFYSIDFQHNAPLTTRLETFLNKVSLSEEPGSHDLLSLLELCRAGRNLELCSEDDIDDEDESSTYFLHVMPTKKSVEERLMEWDSFRSSKRAKMSPKILTGVSAAETKAMDQFKMAASLMDLTPVALSRRSENFVISDHTAASLVEQLTLLEQEMFGQTHPVHFLNSKAHGVGVALSMQGQRTPLLPRKKDEPVSHNLFVSDPPLEPMVHRWITYNQDISHWVAAEIIVCPSAKSQVAMLSKFIEVAQLCADVRNFATCLSVLGGLENLIVRQLPVWKNLPAKCVTTMEQLATLKMQLKSDPDVLMKEKDSYLLPTIPSVLYFLLHVQQLEIGGFRLANGMYKWGKMRSISQMIDMIRLFKNNEYLFERDSQLLNLLRRRIQEFDDKDLQAIASNSDINVQKVGTKGIHGALRKIKDKLQSKGSK